MNLIGFFFHQLAGVLVFSAVPFTAVKAIANSPVGEWLQIRMIETKKAALQDSSRFKALAEKARDERYIRTYLSSNFIVYVANFFLCSSMFMCW